MGDKIKYIVDDALNTSIEDKYDFVHDKGMLDAIVLCLDEPEVKIKKYVNTLRKLLAENGLLIVTSCNLTPEELIQLLAEHFVVFKQLAHKSFQFGSKVGNALATVSFKHKIN